MESGKEESTPVPRRRKGVYPSTKTKQKKCCILGCSKAAKYNTPGKKFKLYCIDHKTDDMTLSFSNKCVIKECFVEGSYGYNDGKSATHCYIHKLEGMYCKKHHKCVECEHIAYYNESLDGKPTHCTKHKTDGMFRIYNAMCLSEGCIKRASFSKSWDEKPSYCHIHVPKEDEYVDKRFRRCNFKTESDEQCNNTAYYGYKSNLNMGYGFVIACGDHATEEMVYVSNRHITCEYGLCKHKKYNNTPFCFQHSTFRSAEEKLGETTKSSSVNYQALALILGDDEL